MAIIPYLALGPNTLASIYGLIRGPDTTKPTPPEDWRDAVVDVVIPALNEEKNIILCLSSLKNQTLQPRQIIIIDDGSSDKTLEYAKDFCEENNINYIAIKRKTPIGKTPTIKRQSREFDSDVEFILDADTILLSSNYIERTVQELYKAVGIASACGVILPLLDHDRKKLAQMESVKKFKRKHPKANFSYSETLFSKINRSITNIYRNVLYIYLQKFIYVGQMKFCGSITNPVGCAVAYRRRYIKDLFDRYEPIMGDDLTTSEDIFIGFALANKGYRNIQLNDVYAKTQEPEFTRLFNQIYLWSSSFFQSCYYFNDLAITPFKVLKNFITLEYIKQRKKEKHFAEKRKIKEPYRQPFGEEITKKRGRPLGWHIFFSLTEKVLFPVIMLLMITFRWWEAVIVTLVAENIVFLATLIYLGKKHALDVEGHKEKEHTLELTFGGRTKFILEGIAAIPIRYASLLVDLVALFKFASDIWIFRNKKWRK